MKNDRYEFAFGVDSHLGAFFQVWERAAEGESEEADETGAPHLSCSEQYGPRCMTVGALARNDQLKRAWSKIERGLPINNQEAVVSVGKALGFDCSKAVYELWD